MRQLKLITILAIMVMSLSLTSCDEVEDQLVGTWEVVSFQDWAISKTDVSYHIYRFNYGHTGYMDAYDESNRWVRYPFHWYSTDDSISLDWDAQVEPDDYFVEFSNGFLWLTYAYDTSRYWSYRRI